MQLYESVLEIKNSSISSKQFTPAMQYNAAAIKKYAKCKGSQKITHQGISRRTIN